MNLRDLLAAQGLTSALIVDDAYDQVPRAEDLPDPGPWATFMDDLGADVEQVRGAFPDFDNTDGNVLRSSDAFVASLWGLRGRLRPQLWAPLFEVYEQATSSDRAFLGKLEAGLRELGVEPVGVGRTLAPVGCAPGIVFVDLFLGAAQVDADTVRSVRQLQAVMKGREDRPPVVILMSRSPLLSDRKAQFRDDTGLIGALFRVYNKHELLEGQMLERALDRLASHYEDAIKVASFLVAWDQALGEARGRFLRGMRRLDLSDYAQIRHLLLDHEGQPLGSYLLDVCDRVLQHEIEAHNGTAKSAQLMGAITLDRYPAPHIAGTPDLQDMMYRCIWQHPTRLSVTAASSGYPVSFGDVLIRRSRLGIAPPGPEENEADALVVMTPSCDLVRGGVERVLLMAGDVSALGHSGWKYRGSAWRTAILILPENNRVVIEWKKKDVQLLTKEDLTSLLDEEHGYRVVNRLREGCAIEIQQRLLADMGRVGGVANMPATFAVRVEAYSLGTDESLKQLSVPSTARDGGVCYTGRDQDSKTTIRLVLTEEVGDELLAQIGSMSDVSVHPRARATMTRLKASRSFARMLSAGLEVPEACTSKVVEIKVPGDRPEDGQTPEVVGLMLRNPSSLEGVNAQKQNAALVLVLRDVEHG